MDPENTIIATMIKLHQVLLHCDRKKTVQRTIIHIALDRELGKGQRRCDLDHYCHQVQKDFDDEKSELLKSKLLKSNG